eukprot:scaffold71424_cov21-Phaeocystis_antarctica.AAC.1
MLLPLAATRRPTAQCLGLCLGAAAEAEALPAAAAHLETRALLAADPVAAPGTPPVHARRVARRPRRPRRRCHRRRRHLRLRCRCRLLGRARLPLVERAGAAPQAEARLSGLCALCALCTPLCALCTLCTLCTALCTLRTPLRGRLG